MRVVVDRDRCCGSGNCVRISPDVFDQDDEEGLVLLRRPEPPDTVADQVAEAVRLCPTEAISLVPSPIS